MPKRIVYMGDTSSPGPADYLIGIMTRYALPFLYVPSGAQPPAEAFDNATGLFVLSDYASGDLSGDYMGKLCSCVKAGAGLLMLGGWESYHGLGGDWDSTPLATLLPVEILSEDDRRNCPQPVLIKKVAEHPILGELPFDRPAGIGGYNEFRPRPDSQTILQGERFLVRYVEDHAEFSPAELFPLLVTSEGAGSRRACLATDVAPHWVGGFVDWGSERLHIDIPGGFVEIGADYARFFRNLLLWTMGD